MHTLNPSKVTFGAVEWLNVRSVTIDRRTTREAIGWSDAGPHPTFADAPEQRVDITIIQELTAESGLSTPRLSDSAAVSFTIGPSRADADRYTVTASAVCLSITHELDGDKTFRKIKLIAISSSGSADPITITAL